MCKTRLDMKGFNDMVGGYPRVDPSKGKKSINDYSEYSRLLACLIRDVRKDLSAPKLPFVVGVLGVGGEKVSENAVAFRDAMAAPAKMDEFKGNVANVFTEEYWPTELDDVLAKEMNVKKQFTDKQNEIKKRQKEGENVRQDQANLNKEIRATIEKTLTEDELFLLDKGKSNQGFHYYGSAKFFGQIGKAFAETLVDLKK